MNNLDLTSHQILSGAVVGFLILIFIYLVGIIFVSLMQQSQDINPAHSVLIRFSVGLTIALLASLALLLLGLFNPFAMLILMLMLCILGFSILWFSSYKQKAKFRSILWREIWLLLSLPSCLFWIIIASLALYSVRAPGVWDDTMYQLPIASTFATNGTFEEAEYLRYPFAPALGNLFAAVGLLFGNVISSQVLLNAISGLILLAFMAYSFNFKKNILAGLVGFATIWLANSTLFYFGLVYVDLIGTTFLIVGVYFASTYTTFFSDASNKIKLELLLLSGAFLGFAASTKYQLALIVLIFIVAQAFIMKIKTSLLLLLSTIIVALPWYLRSWIVTGDPVHPALGNLFGFYLWNASDLEANRTEQLSHGVPIESLDLFGSLVISGNFILITAVVALFFWKTLNNQEKVILAVVLLYTVVWFSTGQVDRYLLPAIGLNALVITAILAKVSSQISSKRYFRRFAVAFAIAASLLILILSTIHALNAIQVYKETLESRPGYKVARSINEFQQKEHDTSPVLGLGYENSVFFFDNPLYGDWFGVARYSQFDNCEIGNCKELDISKIQIFAKKYGIHWIAINRERFDTKNLENSINRVEVPELSADVLMRF